MLSSNFANLYAFSGAGLSSALSQTTGAAATGLRPSAVQMTNQLTNQFLTLIAQPVVDGRSRAAGIGA